MQPYSALSRWPLGPADRADRRDQLLHLSRTGHAPPIDGPGDVRSLPLGVADAIERIDRKLALAHGVLQRGVPPRLGASIPSGETVSHLPDEPRAGTDAPPG